MPGIAGFRVDDANAIEQIKVGDFVRSYDFETHDDCYALGRVAHVGDVIEGCPRYRIDVLKRVFEGQATDRSVDSKEVYPPVNGTPHSFGGFTNGVRKCEGEELEYWTERWADWASDVEAG